MAPNLIDPATARKHIRFTQVEMGLLMGAHPQTVSDWERGVLEPNGRSCELYAAIETVYAAYGDDLALLMRSVIHKKGWLAACAIISVGLDNIAARGARSAP